MYYYPWTHDVNLNPCLRKCMTLTTQMQNIAIVNMYNTDKFLEKEKDKQKLLTYHAQRMESLKDKSHKMWKLNYQILGKINDKA